MKVDSQKYFDLFMEQFPELSPEAKNFTRASLSLEKYSKKEFLFKSEQVQKELGYVCEGLLRKYYINEKGNKITTSFLSERGYATDYPALLRQQPSKYYIDLESSIIIKLPYIKLQEAYFKHRRVKCMVD